MMIKRKFIYIPYFGAVFAVLCFSISHLFAQSYRWNKIVSDQFVVFYLDNDRNDAEDILSKLQEEYPRLKQAIGAELLAPINIYLSNSERVYKHIVGNNLPEWSAGAALPAHRVMVLKSYNTNSDFRKTAIHELVHLLIDEAMNSVQIPRWLNEGLAVYFSGEKNFASTSLISKALMTQSIIDLSDIDYVLTFHESKAQLAYQESYLAVKYLIENYGVQSVREIIKKIAITNDPDKAFMSAIGMDMYNFEYEWYQYVRKNYRWHFLAEFDTYLWMSLPLLFIVIYIIIRIRNRKTLKRWESEESYFDEDEI
ncbi:hypothetical protein GF337_18450 [candidate division KSB1 bacterium]|nr:hypothetical protein [candidate division KSB1 bacterium]